MPRRPGYSMMELLVVLAAVIVLGAAVVPTLSAFGRDTQVKAGADVIQKLAATARGRAIEDGRPYRLAVSTDGQRVQVSPDATDDGTQADPDAGYLMAEDSLPDAVRATPLADAEMPLAEEDGGWLRLATFLPDGTCREDAGAVQVQEPGCYPLLVQIRGLTGATSVTPRPIGGGP